MTAQQHALDCTDITAIINTEWKNVVFENYEQPYKSGSKNCTISDKPQSKNCECDSAIFIHVTFLFVQEAMF